MFVFLTGFLSPSLWVHEMDARVGFFFLLLVFTLDVLNTRFFSFFFRFYYLYFTLSHSFF